MEARRGLLPVTLQSHRRGPRQKSLARVSTLRETQDQVADRQRRHRAVVVVALVLRRVLPSVLARRLRLLQQRRPLPSSPLALGRHRHRMCAWASLLLVRRLLCYGARCQRTRARSATAAVVGHLALVRVLKCVTMHPPRCVRSVAIVSMRMQPSAWVAGTAGIVVIA